MENKKIVGYINNTFKKGRWLRIDRIARTRPSKHRTFLYDTTENKNARSIYGNKIITEKIILAIIFLVIKTD